MSEPENKPPETARPKRSRWLFVVLGAVVVAIAIQGGYMWQMHKELNKAVAAQSNDEGWIEIPRPNDTGQANANQSQSSASQPGTLSPGTPDPFVQPFNPKTWDPFQEMSRMRAQMDQMFNQAFGRFQDSPQFGKIAGEATFSPSFDLTEEPDRYIVKIDVPGSSAHDIKVKLEGQTLTVSGTRTDTQAQKKDGKVLRQERVVGQFERSMNLPEPVDDDKMITNYKDGVFTITLPKLHSTPDQPSESVRMQ